MSGVKRIAGFQLWEGAEVAVHCPEFPDAMGDGEPILCWSMTSLMVEVEIFFPASVGAPAEASRSRKFWGASAKLRSRASMTKLRKVVFRVAVTRLMRARRSSGISMVVLMHK